MTKSVWGGAFITAAVLFLSGTAYAQSTATATIGVTANVNARAKLALGTASVSFADADPDVTATLSSAAISVDVKARTSGSGNVLLTMQASGDLTSGTDTIAIGNLSWAVTGAGFQAGSASTTARTLGSWTGSGNPAGTHTLQLPNSWSYATGSYTATLTYTLTAP